MKSVFITGADGFIGSHLTEKLIKNYKVKALVQYNSFNFNGWLESETLLNKRNFSIIKGDIRDGQFIKNEIKNVDYIIHLAALISIPYSYKAVNSFVDTNINGTINILNAAINSNVKKVILTSTSEVYGSAQYVPMDEKHPLNAQSPYAATKISADQLALSYFNSFNVPVTILRPFNTFGPRQSLRAVIPNIIIQALQNNIVNIGDISTLRDFNYVQDIVKGFEKSLEASSILGEVINLGSGFEISIKELIKLIEKILNKKINLNIQKSRVRPKNSEVRRLKACNKKAKKLLKWHSSSNNKSGLEKSLRETIKWYSEKNNIKKFQDKSYQI